MKGTKPLNGDLLKLQEQIVKYAMDYELDFYPVVFELCDYDTINVLAAQEGFPSRYPHWRFGMEYNQLSKGYSYGIQKIYEMVINTNPCYAYLLTSNSLVGQKLVMSHVYGHADFFKNNSWFLNTNRNMMENMANHSSKIRRYMDKYGHNRVESFIDKVHSVENLLDINYLFKKNIDKDAVINVSHKDTNYSKALSSFISSKKKNEKKEDKILETEKINHEKPFKASPRDIMGFLIENSQLESWELDILGMLREEAYYFLPQRLTKIMNEGWASYWHSNIMTKKALDSSEIIYFADVHSTVMEISKQQINPYKIGIELFRDIEHRWDTGKFGKEYLECNSLKERNNWDLKINKGREKIFEIRKNHNDITFIDEFLTEEFCNRQKMFTYKYNARSGRFEVDTRDFLAIKEKLLNQLTNFGTPIIEVDSTNFNNRGELHLVHHHQGVDLDMTYACRTMENIVFLWKRPVNITTIQNNVEVIFCHNGNEFKAIS